MSKFTQTASDKPSDKPVVLRPPKQKSDTEHQTGVNQQIVVHRHGPRHR